MKYFLPAIFLIALPLFAQGRGGSPWDRLSSMDQDGDGKVSKAEFSGPDRLWDRLDADGDGFVTETEAKSMRGGRGGRGQRGQGRGGQNMLLQRLDTDKDGKVSEEEWKAFFKAADTDGDGAVTAEELGAAMMQGRGGMARRPDNAPKVGAQAPDVSAKTLKEGRDVDLSKPQRTTVLIFGSYT